MRFSESWENSEWTYFFLQKKYCFKTFFSKQTKSRQKINFQKKSENVLHGFFCPEKKSFFFWKKYMSTQNFPKIPKIALRKSCDHFWDLWRAKREIRLKMTSFWVALHMLGRRPGLFFSSIYSKFFELDRRKNFE